MIEQLQALNRLWKNVEFRGQNNLESLFSKLQERSTRGSSRDSSCNLMSKKPKSKSLASIFEDLSLRKTPPSTTRVEVKSNEGDTNRRCSKCQGIWHMAFECPMRRNAVIRELSDGGEEFDENIDPIWAAEEIEEYPEEGELLVVRKALSVTPAREENQRESIFNTRYTVEGKVCLVIMDSGSYTNAVSRTMVEKLKLPI
ncbi:hypothetical protein MLD38_006386 [Melastoma candidum]|uniref:Uncharacterized protein n=1 Tax=Melastoma candidum TaxID=119954 RepID=A0ACB9RN91_9MYRT|nr:hypothetical protein MLD38_006386 [Melastoma candidum]